MLQLICNKVADISDKAIISFQQENAVILHTDQQNHLYTKIAHE